MLEHTSDGNGVEPYAKVPDWMRTMLQTIGRYVHAQTKPLQRRIEDLERRTENWKYVGTFKSGEVYRVGNFCTHAGSLWHCECDTSSVPGTDLSWVLCCKRGKDAR